MASQPIADTELLAPDYFENFQDWRTYKTTSTYSLWEWKTSTIVKILFRCPHWIPWQVHAQHLKTYFASCLCT